MTTGYRIQDASRDINDLLDPEQQYSYPMDGNDDDVRHGVSACWTLAELAAYVATHGIQATRPVIVRVDGPYSEDEPLDAEAGEILILPTEAAIIDDVTQEKFFEAVATLDDSGIWDYSELLEIAETIV